MTQMATRLFAFTANVTSVTSSRVKMEILLKRVIVVKLAQKYYIPASLDEYFEHPPKFLLPF